MTMFIFFFGWLGVGKRLSFTCLYAIFLQIAAQCKADPHLYNTGKQEQPEPQSSSDGKNEQ